MWASERKFANLLDKQRRIWQYHPKPFKIGKTRYQPDFYLPDEDLYIEVVGTRRAYYTNKGKMEEFKILYPHIKFIIVDCNNEIFPYKNIKPRKKVDYINHTISLNDKEEEKLQNILFQTKFSMIDIFRLGIKKAKTRRRY